MPFRIDLEPDPITTLVEVNFGLVPIPVVMSLIGRIVLVPAVVVVVVPVAPAVVTAEMFVFSVPRVSPTVVVVPVARVSSAVVVVPVPR
jgi:hypothetical protein